jgi:hypothetical protein
MHLCFPFEKIFPLGTLVLLFYIHPTRTLVRGSMATPSRAGGGHRTPGHRGGQARCVFTSLTLPGLSIHIPRRGTPSLGCVYSGAAREGFAGHPLKGRGRPSSPSLRRARPSRGVAIEPLASYTRSLTPSMAGGSMATPSRAGGGHRTPYKGRGRVC